MRHTVGQRVLTALSQVALWIWVLLAMVPLVWMATTSIKPEGYAQTIPPTWQFQPTLQHYVDVLQGAAATPFGPLLLHSLIVAVGSTALALVLGLFAAYALARLHFKGKRFLALWILSTIMFPPVVAVIPIFIMAGRLQLIDRYLTLIVPYAAFNLPLVIWVLRSSIRQIPEEIEDAALVDGASRIQIITRIVLPLAAPGIATAGILSMLLAWNEFLFALTLTRSQVKTAPVGISEFTGMFGTQWGSLTAAATTIVAPVVLMALLLRRHLIEGLTLGAVK
ncbi:MAG: carbohydrate ABC transporter permease [Chloroflexi bacterium]|nr:carbohydrate ABC transporter permease [Chloroflexota bacterium]